MFRQIKKLNGALVLFLVLLMAESALAQRLPGRTSGRAYRGQVGRPSAPPIRQPRFERGPKVRPNGISEFRADLGKTRAKSRSGHRASANRQLAKAMNRSPVLRMKINKQFGADAHSRVKRGRNPRGAQWDHIPQKKNALQLIGRRTHKRITKRQGTNGGGYAQHWNPKSRLYRSGKQPLAVTNSN